MSLFRTYMVSSDAMFKCSAIDNVILLRRAREKKPKGHQLQKYMSVNVLNIFDFQTM